MKRMIVFLRQNGVLEAVDYIFMFAVVISSIAVLSAMPIFQVRLKDLLGVVAVSVLAAIVAGIVTLGFSLIRKCFAWRG